VHTPRGATATDVQKLRQEIESGDVLIKVRFAQVHMKSKAKSGNRSRIAHDTSSLRDQT
jgi:hypothetical protein